MGGTTHTRGHNPCMPIVRFAVQGETTQGGSALVRVPALHPDQ